MSRTRAPYPPGYRAQIIALAHAGWTVERLAREFEPCGNTIRGWLQAARENRLSVDGERLSTTKKPEISQDEWQLPKDQPVVSNWSPQDTGNPRHQTASELEDLTSSADMAALFLDKDLLIKRFTAATASFFNIILSDVGRPLSDLSWRFEDPQLLDDARRALADLRPIIREIRTRSGRTYERRILAYGPRDDQIEGVVVTFVDMTRTKVVDDKLQHQIELVEELTRQKGFLQSLIETAQTAVLLLDAEGRIVLINPYLEEISGYRSDEVLGKDWFTTFLPHEDRETTRALFGRVMSRGINPGHVNPIRTKDGQLKYIEWRAKTITDDIGKTVGVLSTGPDVTERQQLEAGHRMAFRKLEARVEERTRELERRREELNRVGRLDALGRLTGGLAHDFDNLLAVILGNLEMLQARTGKDEDSRQAIEQAREAAELAAQAIERLRSFARRRALEAKPVNLRDAVLGMRELSQRALGDEARIETHIAADLPTVLVDPAALRSALHNLAINARDAMPTGGTVKIAAQPEDVDADQANSFGEIPPGRYVALSVADTGTGMTEDVRQQAFEPFFTTKESGAGTGLGLSMVYGFARQCGGHATLDSKRGQGTTVTLYLPLAEGPDRRKHSGQPSDGPVAARGESILVVEDDPRVRRIAVGQLKQLGYRVFEASNADAAIGIVKRGSAVDLLFTDVAMPGKLTVVDLVDVALAANPEIKILLTTGHSRHRLLDALNKRGAFKLLRKPYADVTLARGVRSLLDG